MSRSRTKAPPPRPKRPAQDGDGPVEPGEQTTTRELQRLQKRMRRVMEAALEKKGVKSWSPHQSTRGAYQTVRFGESEHGGYRGSRPNLLAGFNLEGRSVCDLGANLGEVSRDLRRAGAARVDGYEYDHYFTQMARYITAYNGLSDVNHFQADVSEPGFLRGEYDVCVGLSAFSFMKESIDYICEHVSETMIIETHRVTERWHEKYVEPIAPHFPHWCCFGQVTHGSADRSKRRIWLAFSKRPLIRFYAWRARAALPDAEGVIEVDLPRSRLPWLTHFAEPGSDPLSDASLGPVAERLEEHERRLAAGEPVNLSMAGEAYWLALLSGIAQFNDHRGLDEANVYLKWMRRGIEAGALDRDQRLPEESALRMKVSLRLAALAEVLRNRDASRFEELPIAFNPTPHHPALDEYSRGIKTLAVSGSDELLWVPRSDGNHRLFAMRLLGIDKCPMLTIWDPQYLNRPRALARVENYERRMYQYIAGADVDDPIVAPRPTKASDTA